MTVDPARAASAASKPPPPSPPPDGGEQSAAAAPRKRRRRAPTTGAADDCFACQEKQAPCDRRRPYCSQCIERGRTCSGYKTQLTWGVGVASRGKLRGLSLPVVTQKGKKAGASDSKASTSKPPKSAKTTRPPQLSIDSSQPASNPPPVSSYPTSAPVQYAFLPHGSQEPFQSPASTQFTWTAPTSTQPIMPSTLPQNPKKHSRRHSLQPLQMPPPPSSATEFSPMPMTAGGFGLYSDTRFNSAVSDSPVTPSYQQYHEPMGMDRRYQMQMGWPGQAYMDQNAYNAASASWQPPEQLGPEQSAERSTQQYQEEDAYSAGQAIIRTLDGALAGNGFGAYPGPPAYGDRHIKQERDEYGDMYIKQEPDEYGGDLDGLVLGNLMQRPAQQPVTLSMSNQLSHPAVGNTPQLRELIHYYDHVIAPVIVAFDSPTNPFRNHILRLASGSEALQHAIAALSASNLRMRREHEPQLPRPGQQHQLLMDGAAAEEESCETTHDVSVRKSSMAHSILRSQVERQDAHGPLGQQSPRELYHKGESIRRLNASLSRLVAERSTGSGGGEDATVLATLLVLCLYHICDTGVAKFRTQFAGVKKLLALRGKRGSPAQRSRDADWLLTMFKWFDAMTATVNDREGQFDEDASDLALPPQAADEWALENLAGCDSRLFRVIAKLGRINLLSQGKPVRPEAGGVTPRPPKPPRLPAGMDPAGLAFDGNGWGNLVPIDEAYPSAFAAAPAADAPPSAHTAFGAEWWSLRQELLDWRFDPATVPPAMMAASPPPPPPPGAGLAADGEDPHVRDLRHISEAFRHAALVYLERVAHPRRPSAAPGFRALVAGAIAHIRAVKSDVYLLWPLFITGTECVEEPHRDLIRARCRGIQSDSGFYNNTSTLTLLEGIWADRDALGPAAYADAPGDGPFKWRRAMEGGEEEYIVI